VKSVVLLPTYNERENLAAILPAVRSASGADILVIDDASPDGTGELAEQIAKTSPFLSVLHRARKLGLGTAYVEGFRWALDKGYDAVIQMDSDFSHDPEDLPRLIRALEKADFVIGSRYVPGGSIRGWSWHRKAISAFGNFYARAILSCPVRDLTGGFKVWSRRALESLELSSILSDGYSFQIETTVRALSKGYRFAEEPIVFKDRRFGSSKLSKKIVWEAVWKVWKLRRHRS
jgi:dolichol-phosphate mannosyltransferase